MHRLLLILIPLAISWFCGSSALYCLSALRNLLLWPLSFGLSVGVSAGDGLSVEFAGLVILLQQSGL